ncbi:S41 family peptidase [Wolbachia endosymbiont of Ctenocephalides felis wCfeJ]|uniref:S41 family peptidase n=1 Tax=Wolbachia endosymbiont of Ctenocephalides felis wCfeJ TaxID=2732594 RepID=UPI001445F27B|nr:S41 family peptidase [Wolbachia endosymbiont of Ctenocephalides felis wCfeJ]WCR58050.1 MAG: putative CtpA-like serine protease [Wolbachia endosymbiont of Ctenocephalides felis wCfeJ]
MKIIIATILFLFAYGSSAKQTDHIELLEYIIKKIEKEYVWSVDQKTLIKYAIESVLDKLSSELSNKELAIDFTSDSDGIEYFEELLTQMEREYSNLIDQKTLIESAIIRIFSKLDSYSYYLDSEGFKKMQPQALESSAVSTKIIGDIAYIKISEFSGSTGYHFERQWFDVKENNNVIKGVILDLRNNHGGLFSQAVLICDSFLDGGKIVTVESREKKHYNASKGDMFSELPVVVLINEKSASASEIVAAALQNNKRAKIIGVRSYGKASGQTIFPLKNGGAISVTNKLYYLPSGDLITGVTPDIVVINQNDGKDQQLAKGIEVLNSMHDQANSGLSK